MQKGGIGGIVMSATTIKNYSHFLALAKAQSKIAADSISQPEKVAASQSFLQAQNVIKGTTNPMSYGYKDENMHMVHRHQGVHMRGQRLHPNEVGTH